MGRPSDTHEARREVLDAIAILAGFTRALPSLPDGRRPDVIRLSAPLTPSGIFIGDAKDCETAGRVDTQVQLAAYARWVHVACSSGALGVLAICCSAEHGNRWATTLNEIVYEVTGTKPVVSVSDLQGWNIVSWACEPRAVRSDRAAAKWTWCISDSAADRYLGRRR